MVVCENCGESTRWSRGSTCANCGAELIQPPPQQQPDEIYKEPTGYLRLAVYILWLLIAVSAIATTWLAVGIVVTPTLPYILFVLSLFFLTLLQIWIAWQLPLYNNRARQVYIIILTISLLVLIVLCFRGIILSWPAIMVSAYSLVVLVLHKPTTKLFSGKYYPEPRYT